MEFTGERFLPSVGGEIRQEHLHRYVFAAALVEGKVVLDAACGEGYGSDLLARRAAQVIGVDIDGRCIDHARATYAHHRNLLLQCASVQRLPLGAQSIDVVVSFETLEHLAEQEQMLAEFRRVLRPDGLLIISTPNRAVYSDECQQVNPFHVRELYQPEFEALLKQHFKLHALYGQRLATGSTLFALPGAPGRRSTAPRAGIHGHGSDGVRAGLPDLDDPMYLVALATNGDALPRPPGSVLLSSVDDLYLEFRRIASWAGRVDGEFRAAQAAWLQRQHELDAQLERAAQALQARPTQADLDQALGEAGRCREQLSQERRAHVEALMGVQARLEQAVERLAGLADAMPADQAQALRRELDEARAAHGSLQLEWATARTQLAERLAAEQVQMQQAAQRQAEQAAQSLRALQEQLLLMAQDKARDEALLNDLREQQRQADLRQLEREAQQAEQVRLWRRRMAQALADNRRLLKQTRATQEATAQLTHERAQLEQQRAADRDALHELRLQHATELARIESERASAQLASAALAQQELARVLREQQAAAAAVRAEELATLESRHARERGEWAERNAHCQDTVRRLQTQVQEVETASKLALEASAQRERSLQQLTLHRTHLAAALGRELLAARAAPGWRLMAAWRRIARLRQAGPAWDAADGALQMAQAAVLLPSAAADGPLPAVATPSTASLYDMNLLEYGAIAIHSVEDLLELEPSAFVHSAYRALLGRPPDEDGLQHYRHALERGRSRLEVLADLRYSAEGRRRRVTLPGLDPALRRLRLSRIPLLGRMVPPPALAPTHGVRRDLAALAHRVTHADSALQQRLDSLERALQVGIQGLAQHAMQADARIDAKLTRLQGGLDGAVRSQLQSLADSAQQAQEQAAARAEETRQHVLHIAQASAIAQALGRHAWPDETDVWRLAEQWVGAATDTFIESLFATALGRPPQPHETAHFAARLSEGASRGMLVDKVLSCDEFRHRRTASAPTAAAARMDVPATDIGARPAGQAAVSGDDTPPVLPEHAQPVVSVVIPVYGKLPYTMGCLRSIAAHPPAVPFEIIVVDDCSPDETAHTLQGMPGVRLIRNASNQGFIRSCNLGAAAARGSYLCLLNNDTEVRQRWLDELHATFQRFPGTGYVGSKLLYPDGRLQEAGGILWQDGSAWNYGHGQNPELPEFNYAREVDYCSGASIMMPLGLYRRLGGLDEHYLPAYCEDSDMALKVRQAGLRVLYQPLSQVVHHEGVTSGTDTGSGVKAYQVANTGKLYERWKSHLASHTPNGVQVERAKDRMATRRVLVIDIVTPTADRDAGSVTVFNTLLLLREMRMQATFIPEDNFWNMPGYTAALQGSGVEALYAPHVSTVEQHLQACGSRYDLVLLWRPSVVDRHLAAVRQHCPQAKVLYHTVDLHFLRLEREAHLLGEASRLEAAARMKAMELRAVRSVDCAIVHSTHEREVLASEGLSDNVVVFPLIVDVPGSAVPFEARSGMAFVGGFQHVPNVDAVHHFVHDVMPLIRQLRPGLRLHIIGSNMPQQVLELAADDVVIEGFVPNLQPVLDRMRMSVAPLRYGAGIKGKVGNSMAMGLPVVATGVAVEGMQLEHGTDVLIADDPQGLAEAVCRLNEDPQLWARLQAAGVARMERLSGARTAYGILAGLLRRLGLEVEPPRHRLRLYRDGL
jgi:GT2 family glycosyltransferase/SAM-dependent methyltransferase/glycosyltransferase involved in cell wall biosynthesis